jgi:CarD-like/TRCF domain
MLIHRIAAQLYTAEALQTVEVGLDAGEDVTLAVSQSGRTLMAAAQFARRPRPTVYIVSGEDAADRAARSLAAYVGLAHVCRFPERKDYPWREQAPDDAVVAQRCEALGRIVRGDNCIMVASARALLRCVPPVESRYWESTTFAVGEEIPFDEVPQRLVGMGYTNAGAADAPGLFRVHGDTVEVFPAQEKAPVRIEFFGDEIDRIRRMVSSTGQTIGNEDSIEIFPCRELALTDEAVHNMHVALYRASQDDSKLAALLEMVDARIVTPELDRFLPVMYGQTVSPLAHVSGKALVVLSEPRSLFDDCLRAYEDIEARAGEAGVDRLDGLYVRAQQLDFGAQQRLNYVSLIRAGGAVTAELKIEQPAIAGSDNRFMTRIQEVVGKRYACVFAIPDRGARESMELTFGDEGITFEESLTAAPENAGVIGERVRVAAADSADRAARQDAHAAIRERKADALNARSLEAGAAQAAAGAAVPTISRGRVTFVDAALPQGVVVPDANLAVFSIADLNARMDANRARSRRKVDITQITFPFKPGDYVVHATHGIALFSEIARQEVGGKERDYFLLEYADGDKLYVPLEQVDRITRYVGPDGDKPRLTRLNTADWTRATNKARKNAKSWRLTWSICIRAARRLPVSPARPTRPSRSRWRRASPTTRRATSWRLSPTSRPTWRRPSPWTACCAATWALARPRSLCARRLSAWTPAARSWCSAPRPFWPSSTTRRSLSALLRLALRSRCSAASAHRRSKSAHSRRSPRARLTCLSARTACFRPM